MSLDRSFLLAVAGLRRPWLDPWMRRYSMLGNNGIGWVVAGVVVAIGERSARPALVVAATTWLALAANFAVKAIVRRDRPGGRVGLPAPLISAPASHAFPSSHAAMSAAAAVVLGPIAWPFAVLMAVSRLYLAVHWPSDVAVGLVLGCAIGLTGATLAS